MSDDRTAGKVVRLDDFRRRHDPEYRAAEQEKRRKREAEQRAELRRKDLLRLRKFETDNGPDKQGLMFNRSDRIDAAFANGELAEEAKKRPGITFDKIDEIFGGSSDRYRLPPGLDTSSPGDRNTAERHLMQDVRGYLRLAKSIAKLTGKNADDCALRVVQDTDLWRSIDHATDHSRNENSRDEGAERLQRLVHTMSRFVIREQKLENAFAKLAKIPDPYGNPFPDRYEDVDVRCFDDDTPECFDDHASGLMPRVRLARLPAAELQLTACPVEFTKTGVVGGEGFPATLRLFHDVFLVIGPRTAPANVGPMFETRPWIEMVPVAEADEDSEATPAYVFSRYSHLEFDTWRETFSDGSDAIEPDTGDKVLWAQTAFYRETEDEKEEREFYLKTAQRVRLIGDARDRRGERFANLYWRPRGPTDLEYDHRKYWFDPRKCWRWEDVSWRPVDAGHISALLDREAPQLHDRELRPHYGIAALSMTVESGNARCFPRRTVAFDFESALVTGDLEQALILDSARIDRYIEKSRDDLDERDARLIARWAGDAEEQR